ncbi:MAG: hypothetical protein M1819_001581 [Sarea resinae]|nr:MAG: hypothetical protein M1819_001581 [Sarea resinae]
MVSDPAAGSALLQWVNTFPLPEEVDTLGGLNDGSILWAILSQIDPEYFKGELPEAKTSTNWLPKWQNLKRISKSVTCYIRDECDDALHQPEDGLPDLKAIAMEGSPKETTKLLKIILMAAINSPKTNKQNIEKLASLDIPTQTSIKYIIEDMGATNEDTASSASPEMTSRSDVKSPAMDPELEFEERLGKVMREKDDLAKGNKGLQKDINNLHKRLEHLQQNNDTLQKQLTEAEDSLKSTRGPHDPEIRELNLKIERQADTIADQEAKLSIAESKTETLEKTVESFRASANSAQKLRDELDEIKIERDDLAKKANMAERFRQKLEAGKDLEKEIKTLRIELDESNERLKELDGLRHQCDGLQLTNEEYRKNLPMLEQEIHELQKIKRTLEFDNMAYTQKWESINEKMARDQDIINEQQERLRELESDHVPNQVNGSLDSELDSSEKAASDLQVAQDNVLYWVRLLSNFRKAENLSLKAENEKLKTEPRAEGFMLQQFLDDAKSKASNFEKKYLDSHQQVLVLESQLQAVNDDTASEGYGSGLWNGKVFTAKSNSSKILLETREKLQQAEEELAKTKNLLQEAETNLSSVKHNLVAKESDLSLVDKDKLDVLEELKQANPSKYAGLLSDFEHLKKRCKELQDEVDVHKSLLNTTLLDKDAIQKNLATTKDLLHESDKEKTELKASFDILKASSGGDRDLDAEPPAELASEVVELRSRLAANSEKIEELEALTAELQDKLKRAEDGELEKERLERTEELKVRSIRWSCAVVLSVNELLSL